MLSLASLDLCPLHFLSADMLEDSADMLEEQGYYNELRSLVEEMYAANNMTRVTLVVHSMGGPVSLYFLNNIVSQIWKDTYIHAYIPVAAAWYGGVAALENVISGVSDGVEFLLLLLRLVGSCTGYSPLISKCVLAASKCSSIWQ